MADTAEGSAIADEPESTGAAVTDDAPERMDLDFTVEKVGPCKSHVRVVIPRDAIDNVTRSSVEELLETANVPGFRVGHVPEQLIRKRFKQELADQVKQQVLMASLEQVSEEADLEPINVPNLDPEAFEIPEEGDFEYEFDVEVRPEFDLPDYKGLEIDRPVRETTDEDVEAYMQQFLEEHGQLEPVDEPVTPGDFVTVDVVFSHDGARIRELEELSVRVRPVLRFYDAELEGFDKLMEGAVADDVRECDLTISMEAESVEMRSETVHAKFTVLDVKRLRLPELNQEFFDRISVDDEEDLKNRVRSMLERQVTYEQRQATRQQVLEKITESADWDLPEDLVEKQVENALRREVLEMQQAGFSRQEIQARKNDLRQRSVTMTRKNLKEHFVLDRIAEEEKIEVSAEDIDQEILMMAVQSGENPRRVRARLQKSGVIENLEAQIRERKAVDLILRNARFNDIELPPPTETEVEAVDRGICSRISDTDVKADGDEEETD